MFTPGLFARVQLEGSGEFKALLIDDKAVLTDQDRKYVYVLGPDNTAVRKDIELGRMVDGLRVVESGLDADRQGDRRTACRRCSSPGMPVAPQVIAMGDAAAGTVAREVAAASLQRSPPPPHARASERPRA